MATTSKHYFIILCGGTGPRLWPLSRADRPKQFLSLFGKKSLLEQTFERAKKICPTKNILLVSNKRYKKELESVFAKKIPQENFLYEPLKRNTAMAITFAISQVHKRDPDAVVVTSPSDHYIEKSSVFKKDINLAYKLAEAGDNIVTLGIKATEPNPSFGYIIPHQKNHHYFSIGLFIEKPDRATAEKLIKKNCFWNSGIYTFKIKTLLSELKNIHPEYFEAFEKLRKNPSTKELENIFKKSPKLSIDKAISEKSKKLLLVPLTSDWSDVGEWQSIYKKLKANSDGHANIGDQTEIVSFESKNCLLETTGKKIIGLVGVENLAVIDTPDGLLICNLNKSANVRDLISKMVSNKKQINFFLKSSDKK